MAGPIGGEVPPGLSSNDYQQLYATSQGREMIETGHYSTMKPGSVAAQYSDRHMELHKRFGYNRRSRRPDSPGARPSSGRVGVELKVRNIGVAPFYYDWQVQFAPLGDNGQPVAVSEAEAYDLGISMPAMSSP